MADRFFEFELSVGDVLQIGEHTVTVVDIDGPDVSFRIDGVEESTEGDLDFVLRSCVPGK